MRLPERAGNYGMPATSKLLHQLQELAVYIIYHDKHHHAKYVSLTA